MASATRSLRRTEGLQERHPNRTNAKSVGATAGPLTQSAPRENNEVHQVNPSPKVPTKPVEEKKTRSKRRLNFDAAEGDLEDNRPRKTRIAVEIPSRHTVAPNAGSGVPRSAATSGGRHTKPQRAPVITQTQPQTRQASSQRSTISTLNNNAESQHSRHDLPSTTTRKTGENDEEEEEEEEEEEVDSQLTKHQAKVANGIKHELGRLQPSTQEQNEIGGSRGGRKLRSQESGRYKSELSAYFPEYDEIIGNEEKETHLLNLETPIILYDSAVAASARASGKTSTLVDHLPQPCPVRGFGDALFTDVFDCQRIDFGFLESQVKNAKPEDPLSDQTYEHVHKRAKRLEKSIRNTEKGRAQHEKDQIVRLLEGLQGHDWLRIMGVSGVTESKKKTFEPAREYFITGCQGILDKFRNWAIEEKRRKLEKEKALAKEGSEPDDDGADEVASSLANVTPRSESTEGPSPAKQLREEALARSQLMPKQNRRGTRSIKPAKPPRPPEPEKPFTSFFRKKHERDTALSRGRRLGRKVLAWGLPIPDMEVYDFHLPERYRDVETMKARERKKRRDRRESKHR